MARFAVDPTLARAVVFEDVSLTMPSSRRRGGHGTRHRIRRLVGESSRELATVFEGVSTSIALGQSVALLGGAKSGREEFLRLAAGTLMPDKGHVRRRSSVLPILDDSRCLSVAHTTRQNIYLTGALLGMTPEQTAQELPWIVEMTGAGKWLDHFLRDAPRNLRQRLVWAVSMATRSRIFAIEGALVIGTGAFEERCWSHVEGLKADGVTFIVMSNEADLLMRFCDRALVLKDGGIIADTTVDEGLKLSRLSSHKSDREDEPDDDDRDDE